jgi:hypothetical protein
MILRRLSKHVKDHNWFAVGLDFLIVVIGVFVGLQVSNWNATRLEARGEAAMLARIEEDFRALRPGLERSIARYDETIAATGQVILQLRQAEPPADDAAFRRMLGKAAFLWYTPPLAPVYSELTSTGGLSRLSDPRLRAALARYGEAYALFSQIQPQAKTVLTDPRAHFHNAVEWSVDPDDWELENAILAYDLDALRPARSEMQIWQGYQFEIATVTRSQLQEVDAILALLEEARR